MVPEGLKKFTLCTVGAWLLIGLANGLIVVMTPVWGYVTIASVFGAPVVGYVLGVRLDLDLSRFAKFLLAVIGLTLVPYAAFQTWGPISDSIRVLLIIRLMSFIGVLSVAYYLIYE
ncbi:hypothetical protein NGM10_01595 [Halorussus salilacus]|uniref:hypothetical protein n=1 Tax=Halorussus salilacus TaxID=2953750 RepID=UPI00209ED8DB|nr:hypothetical protein [Halorussus salilacus]USZ68446.1 hypothetical protein NGM10_01595 [Halorussus salilacus]